MKKKPMKKIRNTSKKSNAIVPPIHSAATNVKPSARSLRRFPWKRVVGAIGFLIGVAGLFLTVYYRYEDKVYEKNREVLSELQSAGKVGEMQLDVTAAVRSTLSKQDQAALDRSASMIRAGDYVGANAELESTRKHLTETLIVTEYYLAVSNYMRKDFHAAVTGFVKYLGIHPENAEAHYNLGLSYDSLGKPQLALKSFDQAIARQTDFSAAWRAKCLIVDKVWGTNAALACFQRALQLRPKDRSLIYAKCFIMHGKVQADEVIKCYREYQGSPGAGNHDADAMNNLGVTLRDQGKQREALKYFRRALELNDRSKEAWWNLCTTLALIPETRSESSDCYSKYVNQIDSKNKIAWYNMGTLMYESGQLDRALIYFDKALALANDSKYDSDDAKVIRTKSAIMAKKQDFEQALSLCETLLTIDPTSDRDLVNKGTILTLMGRTTEALAALKRSLQLKPNGKVSAQIGFLLAQTGDREGGLYYLKSAIPQLGNEGSEREVKRQVMEKIKEIEPHPL